MLTFRASDDDLDVASSFDVNDISNFQWVGTIGSPSRWNLEPGDECSVPSGLLLLVSRNSAVG